MAQSELSAEGRLSNLRSFFGQNPCAFICAFGFAFSLMTWFPGRLGVDRNFISRDYAYLTDSIVVVLLILLVVLWAKSPDFKLGRSKAFIGFVGVASTLCFLAEFGPLSDLTNVPETAAVAVEGLYKLLSTILLLLWLEEMTRFSARFIPPIMGAGCLMLAVFELLLIGLQDVISQVLFALSPVAITTGLFVFLHVWDRMPDRGKADGDQLSVSNQPAFLPAVITSLGLFMLSLVGSSIQTYVMHIDPMPLNSTLFGFFDAMGLVLAAVVLISAAISSHWRARMRDVLLVTPSILLLAYVLSVVMPEGWAYLTYVPLAVARRLSIVLLFIALVAQPRRSMATVALALAAYRLAQTVGTMPLLLGAFDYLSPAYSLIIIGELVITVVICPLIASVCLHRNDQASNEIAAPVPASDPVPASPAEIAAEPADRTDPHQEALDRVSQAYGLSNRESDVLALLAEGWRAAAIAEKLVLSPATVKNHMNHIYGKLGVHSQDEVLYLVEKERHNTAEKLS